MAHERVDIIRRGHEGFSRGDLSWTKQFVAEDVEWRPTGSFPGLEGVYRGPEALERWMATIRAEWEEFEVTLDEVVKEEGDTVVVVERLWGRGRESGVETEMRIYGVYRFNAEGRISQRLAFETADEALAALRSSSA
jgi:ketosteroid isomerase-like protein